MNPQITRVDPNPHDAADVLIVRLATPAERSSIPPWTYDEPLPACERCHRPDCDGDCRRSADPSRVFVALYARGVYLLRMERGPALDEFLRMHGASIDCFGCVDLVHRARNAEYDQWVKRWQDNPPRAYGPSQNAPR